MNARALPPSQRAIVDPMRLHHLALRAIAASAALTYANLAGQAIDDARFACIDQFASAARHALLDCLKHDFGIDETMANQLGALL